jgi:hypothetical protein
VWKRNAWLCDVSYPRKTNYGLCNVTPSVQYSQNLKGPSLQIWPHIQKGISLNTTYSNYTMEIYPMIYLLILIWYCRLVLVFFLYIYLIKLRKHCLLTKFRGHAFRDGGSSIVLVSVDSHRVIADSERKKIFFS